MEKNALSINLDEVLLRGQSMPLNMCVYTTGSPHSNSIQSCQDLRYTTTATLQITKLTN